MDLMDMVKGAVSKSVMNKIGGLLGTDEKKTSSVFETAAGSILGGLIKKSGTPDGARDVFDMASKQDTGVLDKLDDLLGGGKATEDFQKSGGGILDGIFGSNQGGMLATIAKFLGLEGGMMGTVMKMIAPIVMGVIGKHIKNKALDAVGLGSFLGEQKKSLGGFMPASLTSDLGFGNLLGNVGDAVGNVAGAAGDAGRAAVGAAGDAVGAVGDAGKAAVGAAGNAGKAAVGAAGDAAGAGFNILKLLLPLILIGALIFGAWKIFGGAASNAVNNAGDAMQNAADGVGNAASGVAGAAGDAIGGMKIPGMDMSSIEGFDMGSMGAAGPALTKGFGDIASGFEGLKDSGMDGAKDLAGKITGFSDSIDGMGLGDLTGAGKASATGLIGKFIEMVKGLMGGQSEGIQGILKPAIDGLMEKLNPFAGG